MHYYYLSLLLPWVRYWRNTVKVALFEISNSTKPHPSVFHAYTGNMKPAKGFFEPNNLDEVSNRIPPTPHWEGGTPAVGHRPPEGRKHRRGRNGKRDSIHHQLLEEIAAVLESRQKPLHATPSGWRWCIEPVFRIMLETRLLQTRFCPAGGRPGANMAKRDRRIGAANSAKSTFT